MVNEQLLRSHYRFLQHEAETEVRLFGQAPDNPSYRGTWCRPVKTEQEFVDLCTEFSLEGFNVGVGINERSPGGTTDEDVIALRFIPLDLDVLDQEVYDQVLASFKENHVPVAAIAFSGQKGYHFYVPIEPVTDKSQIKQTLDNAKHYFTTVLELPFDDKCFNPSRVLRVWGTRNAGREVELRFVDHNRELTPLPPSFFPPAPPSNRQTVKTQAGRQTIVPDCGFLNALFNESLKIKLVPEASFNDEILPNAVAYAQAKHLDLRPLYALAKKNNQSEREVNGWLSKHREFNYATVRAHVKQHYPALYDQYFTQETWNKKSNLRYSPPSSELTDSHTYKRKHRETDWLTITDHARVQGHLVTYEKPAETITIAYEYEKTNQTNELLSPDPLKHYLFFDELEHRKKPYTNEEQQHLQVTSPKRVQTQLHIGTFTETNGVEWTVLSEEKLDTGDYLLYGTRFECPDRVPSGGHKTALHGVRPFLFLHSYERADEPIKDFKELYERVPFPLREVQDWLFTDQNTTTPLTYDPGDLLTQVYFAWLFSGKVNNRQLNLCVMGPPGSGKTPQLLCLANRFEEKTLNGSNATIKGLTVSFFGENPKPGAFLDATRVLFMDEFFKLINNVQYVDDLATLNGVLDNDTYTAPSGKGDFVVRSRCRVFAVGNPIPERHSGNRTNAKRMLFARMCQVLPSDFLGRFLFYLQTPQERDEVKSKKRLTKKQLTIPLSRKDWKAYYDFVNSTPVLNTDEDELTRITSSIQLGSVFDEIYSKGETRNAQLLFEGIVRTRCLHEQSNQFKAVLSDYQVFEQIWRELHARWFTCSDVDVPNPLQFLTYDEQTLVSKIQQRGDLSMHTFLQNGGTAQLRDKLVLLGLVKHDYVSKILVSTRDDVSL